MVLAEIRILTTLYTYLLLDKTKPIVTQVLDDLWQTYRYAPHLHLHLHKNHNKVNTIVRQSHPSNVLTIHMCVHAHMDPCNPCSINPLFPFSEVSFRHELGHAYHYDIFYPFGFEPWHFACFVALCFVFVHNVLHMQMPDLPFCSESIVLSHAAMVMSFFVFVVASSSFLDRALELRAWLFAIQSCPSSVHQVQMVQQLVAFLHQNPHFLPTHVNCASHPDYPSVLYTMYRAMGDAACVADQKVRDLKLDALCKTKPPVAAYFQLTDVAQCLLHVRNRMLQLYYGRHAVLHGEQTVAVYADGDLLTQWSFFRDQNNMHPQSTLQLQ